MMVNDRFGNVMQLLLVISCGLCIAFSENYLREKRIAFGEFYPLVLWSTSGAMLMATSRNLLVIFLGLEVLSIALYVMAGMSRSEEKSEESALKYFLLDASGVMADYWLPGMTVIAVLTMTVGNLIALMQKDVKRILGYSSIAHAGYILVAVLAHAKSVSNQGSVGLIGFGTTAYYLLAYAVMTIGAFAVISLSAKDGRERTTLDDLHGLYKRDPFAAGALVVFMASLIGVPPTAGFIGKLFIFSDALQAHLGWL